MTLYRPNLKKFTYQTHFLMFCFDILFNTILSLLCPEFDFLGALTSFFLQVDHLMDSSEKTRVIAGILKNFENFPYFLQISHDLGFKNRVFKSKV